MSEAFCVGAMAKTALNSLRHSSLQNSLPSGMRHVHNGTPLFFMVHLLIRRGVLGPPAHPPPLTATEGLGLLIRPWFASTHGGFSIPWSLRGLFVFLLVVHLLPLGREPHEWYLTCATGKERYGGGRADVPPYKRRAGHHSLP